MIDVFLLGRKKFNYSTDGIRNPKYAYRRVKDVQIRSGLWNSMESKKRSSLVFLPTAQLGLEQVPELYSSVNNFERIYDDLLLPYSIFLCKIIIQNLKIYVKELIFINLSLLILRPCENRELCL